MKVMSGKHQATRHKINKEQGRRTTREDRKVEAKETHSPTL